MDFFSYTNKNWGKNKELFMGFFWCGIMNIHNNKLVYDAYNKLGEYIYLFIYLFI
jgi:hypothetical protein